MIQEKANEYELFNWDRKYVKQNTEFELEYWTKMAEESEAMALESYNHLDNDGRELVSLMEVNQGLDEIISLLHERDAEEALLRQTVTKVEEVLTISDVVTKTYSLLEINDKGASGRGFEGTMSSDAPEPESDL